LVLDWGDGTFGDPVDFVSEVFFGEDWSVGAVLGGSLESVQSLHLSWGLVSEIVDTDGVGSVGGVDFSDLLEVLLELGSSEFELGLGSVHLVVLGNVSDEFVVTFGEDLRLEELSSSWGLVGEGIDGEGGAGTETSDGGLSFHI